MKRDGNEITEEDIPEQELLELGDARELLSRLQRLDKWIDSVIDELMDAEDWLAFEFRVWGRRTPLWWDLYRKIKNLWKKLNQLEELREKIREEINNTVKPVPVEPEDPSQPQPGTPLGGGVVV